MIIQVKLDCVGLKSSFYMEKPVTIRPNFKAELNKAENNIEVVPVNTKLYTSWIDGKTVFRNESIDNLILKHATYCKTFWQPYRRGPRNNFFVTKNKAVKIRLASCNPTVKPKIFFELKLMSLFTSIL